MVSADAPKFVMVVPVEIEEHGLAAAVVLAHIRYRCESGSPGHGLVEIDGARWWPVSHRALGGEVGLSADAVRRALQKLGDVVVSANNRDRPEDQTRAYRPADDSDSSPRPSVRRTKRPSVCGTVGRSATTTTLPPAISRTSHRKTPDRPARPAPHPRGTGRNDNPESEFENV